MRNVALSLLTLAFVSACAGSPNQAGSQAEPTPSPILAPPTTVPTTVLPSATPEIQILATEGTMFPGIYRTAFDPPMTITITHLVDLDCAPGYRCRGDIDVNLQNWVAFEFGNKHGSELDIVRLDQVVTDEATNTLADPPADLAAWIAKRPGITQISAPVTVVVDGISGTRLDIRPNRDLPLGPNYGLSGGLTRVWITVLNVHGEWVLILEVWGPDNTVHDFDAVVSGLQPVIDSIVWN